MRGLLQWEGAAVPRIRFVVKGWRKQDLPVLQGERGELIQQSAARA
jgi:hypothetical protein